MSEDFTEEVKDRLLHELADAPQGGQRQRHADARQPQSDRRSRPQPGPNSIPESFAALDGDFRPDETGEEEDPGDANAGGVPV